MNEDSEFAANPNPNTLTRVSGDVVRISEIHAKSTDPEKYVQAVEAMCGGPLDTAAIDKAIEAAISDPNLTGVEQSEELERLSKLKLQAEQQHFENRERSGELINENKRKANEATAIIACSAVGAIGIMTLPKIIEALTNRNKH